MFSFTKAGFFTTSVKVLGTGFYLTPMTGLSALYVPLYKILGMYVYAEQVEVPSELNTSLKMSFELFKIL